MAAPQGTVDKAIDVLFHLHRASGPRGLTEVATALRLPKSSTHRLLASLRRRGLVEQDERGSYRPGTGLIALGLGAQQREPAVVAARPVLERAAREVGETFFLVVARGGELLVLDKAEGTGVLRAAPRVGSRVPVHATAVGKLYLAFAPDEVDFDPRRARAFTAATLTDARALEAAVDEARRSGRALNRDEWVAGLSVLAAAVRAGGRLHACIALAAPTRRLDELGVAAMSARVCDAAALVAARLRGEVAP